MGENGDAPGAEAATGVSVLLRHAREAAGIDIATVARKLRIRANYLHAIENGHYTDLPGRTYAIGFVRAYAEFLDLDSGEILRRFKLECDAFADRPELIFPSVVSESSLPGAKILALALVAAGVAYGGWYFYQTRSLSLSDSVPALPDRLASLIRQPVGDGSEVVPVPRGTSSAPAPLRADPVPMVISSAQMSASQTVAASGAAKPAEETPPAQPAEAQSAQSETEREDSGGADEALSVVETVHPAPAQAAAPAESAETGEASSARVVLRVDQDCWVEIRNPQGQLIYSRLFRRGDSYPVPPRPGLVLTVGNAGAMTILVDGKALPSLGRLGMVRRDIALDPEALTAALGE